MMLLQVFTMVCGGADGSCEDWIWGDDLAVGGLEILIVRCILLDKACQGILRDEILIRQILLDKAC